MYRSAFLAAVAIFVVTTSIATGESSDQQIAFFEEHIRPVLVDQCYECHSAIAKNIRGELLLDSREAIRRGGESGPAVVPGRPSESLLLSALRHESFEMPPDKMLPEDVIDHFEKWIADGAADPRERVSGHNDQVRRQAIDLVAGRQFWSFRPIRKPLLPQVQKKHWPANDIDQFILATLEADDSGLSPNAQTDPATLLRRAKFDLVGLSPTIQEIRDFLANPTPNAFAERIDGWLSSRQFGERWGRHWMDVARFAESSGGGRSLMFPHAWRYRDYVIDAFNNDIPFDRFVVEQIAGDLLTAPDIETRDRYATATGFLTLGPINYELQDKELLELEIVDEQIDTIGRAFLGLTLGCVRCHDHKFDPIPMTDYYALAGILTSTESVVHGNVSKYNEQILTSDPAYAAYSSFESASRHIEVLRGQRQEQRAELDRSIKRLEDVTGRIVTVIDDDQAVITGDWKQSTSVPSFVGKHYLASSERAATATFELRVSGRGLLFASYSPGKNRPQKAPFSVEHAAGTSTVTIDQQIAPSVSGLYELLGEFDSPSQVRISTSDASDGAVIVDAIRFIPLAIVDGSEIAGETTGAAVDGADAGTKHHDDLVRKVHDQIAQLKTLESEIQQHARELGTPPPKPVAMAVQDHQWASDTKLRIRGEIRNLGKTVPRGFVSVASPMHADDGRAAAIPLDDQSSGRLELAHWIASPDNPLTARVIVNRVWQNLMGDGIVRTPDNFGLMGQQPTHPELLDFLAADFIESRWSIKHLVRQIMLSRVYQMDSHVTQESLRHDPGNRLLARANRRRLDAEAIRDAMLQVSGQFEECIGGLTIRQLAEYDLDYEFDTRKPSVYVPRFRNSVLGIFQVFDVANPNVTTGRRSVSVLATQALYLMNSEFVIEQARHAADRLLESPGSSGQRLETAYLWTLGRRPTQIEQELMLEILGDENGSDNDGENNNESSRQIAERWAEVFHLLFGSVDFRYVH